MLGCDQMSLNMSAQLWEGNWDEGFILKVRTKPHLSPAAGDHADPGGSHQEKQILPRIHQRLLQHLQVSLTHGTFLFSWIWFKKCRINESKCLISQSKQLPGPDLRRKAWSWPCSGLVCSVNWPCWWSLRTRCLSAKTLQRTLKVDIWCSGCPQWDERTRTTFRITSVLLENTFTFFS